MLIVYFTVWASHCKLDNIVTEYSYSTGTYTNTHQRSKAEHWCKHLAGV